MAGPLCPMRLKDIDRLAKICSLYTVYLENQDILRLTIILKEAAMKHKYTIQRDPDIGHLTVREYAELDQDEMSLLCEERYPDTDISTALAGGRQNLIGVLRTRNIFPPASYAVRIAEAIEQIYAGDGEAVEVVVDDKEFLTRPQAGKSEPEKIDDDMEDDDLDGDEDDLDGLLEDEDDIQAPGTIKIADDEPAGMDDD